MAKLSMMLLSSVASDAASRCRDMSLVQGLAVAVLALLIASEPRQAIFALMGALCYGLCRLGQVELRRPPAPSTPRSPPRKMAAGPSSGAGHGHHDGGSACPVDFEQPEEEAAAEQ
eukprot:TRINITY_DN110983_c0_g1_i1.p1 TRINITY_DN110983_c0_g1~~TRINITY_DN110983_c0_g1_i1.p1  ORF type:complete len:116 (+),score=23.95 TRINITY_DN110983_c0_g1_i1:130-477(+)